MKKPQPRYLFVLFGFRGDLNASADRIRRKLARHTVEVIGKSYPSRPSAQSNYLDESAKMIVNHLMPSGVANYCRVRGEGCLLDRGTVTQRRNACTHTSENFACSRGRPRMIILIAQRRLFDDCVNNFGRCSLVIPVDEEELGAGELITSAIEERLPAIEAALGYLVNLPANLTVAHAPRLNFQVKSGNTVYRDVQADFSIVDQTLQAWQKRLWQSEFRNPRKGKMRGALLLGDGVGFQKDRLHSAATLGEEAKRNSLSFLEAFYLYGSMIEPGMHFDVSRTWPGGEIGVAFTDAVTGVSSDRRSAHENVAPNDRIL